MRRLLTDHWAGPSLSLDIKLLMYDDYIMKIYLVRHGQTDWNAKGLLQGQHDTSLNDTGRAQAREMQEKFQNLNFDLCFSSPLKRAAETAKIICEGRYEIRYDDRLKERSFGKLEGHPSKNRPMENDWRFGATFEDDTFEPLESLFARAKSFLDDLENVDAKNILIVCHGSLAKALHYNIVGYDQNTDFLSWHLENCAYDSYTLFE